MADTVVGHYGFRLEDGADTGARLTSHPGAAVLSVERLCSTALLPTLAHRIAMHVPNAPEWIRLGIAILYLAVFIEASLSKFAARETPQWYLDKFASTWMAKLPLSAMWWTIAVLEFAVAAAFAAGAVSLVLGNPLSESLFCAGLGLSTLTFALLCFGLRVSQDYTGAANAFFYGALSAIIWLLLTSPGVLAIPA